jgi:dihydrofolate reductase
MYMIASILACDVNGGIGLNNSLPWPKLKHDFKHFANLTKNHIIVMGFNTFKSLNFTPLPNRFNIVLIKKNTVVDTKYCKGGNILFIDDSDFLKIIALKKSLYSPIKKNIFIIGGVKVFDTYEEYVDMMYITRIFSAFEHDVYVKLDKLLKTFNDVLFKSTIFEDNNIYYQIESRMRNHYD